MKRFLVKVIISISFLTVLVSGCVFHDVQLPLDTNFSKTELGTKVGKSTAYSVFWIVAWGNAGSRAAAENGNIKIIRNADRKIFSFLFGIYTQTTTIVYGD